MLPPMNHRLSLILIPLLLASVGCSGTPAEPEDVLCELPAGPVPVVDYALVDLPDSLLWYRGTALQSFDDYPQDAHGVIVYRYDGRDHYNPVQMAQRGMWFGDNYRRTGDVRYLERSEAHARRLIDDALEVEGALYFPYLFDFRLHGNAAQVMRAPWYSGMAQGQALSLFLRLYEWTGRDRYREAADGVMASFSRLHREAEPYIAARDCEGYYWIEEYPMEWSTQTLNGFIFAMWGVYEYWRATGDEEAEWLTRASLATLKRYLPDFRDPGNPSYYCLKHRAQYPIYHSYHVQQLLYVHRLSGDPYFEEMARQFQADYTYAGS